MNVSSPHLNWVLWSVAGAVAAYLIALMIWKRKSISLDTLLQGIDQVSTWIGKAGAWSILALTMAMCFEVFSRYLMQAPTDWAFDASYILYGMLFMLAGPYALARNAHVRGDFLYRQWPVRRQAGLDLVLYFLFFFPGILALCYAGYGFAAFSWVIGEKSSNSPNGPPLYHFKTLIPLVGGLMILQGLAEVARCIVAIRTGAWPERLHDVEETEKIILEQAEAQTKGAA
jgi:TRAP-type mannitol/chloroaromatic compound transport system permease small subunit